MTTHGADVDELRRTARQFDEASQAVWRHRAALASMLQGTGWHGIDADLSRADWYRVGAPALARVGLFMESLGQALFDHAAAQQDASAASAEPVGVLRHAFASPPAPSISGLRPVRFGDVGDGRANLVAAMDGFADERRIGRDEIEIRALDNGRYVVVLPGVTDMSEGLGIFASRLGDHGLFGVDDGVGDAQNVWSDNDEPTVRKMRYAYEAALYDDTTVNEYSTMVIVAMRKAGVPAGADVMLVGHSFGAYTAIDLAANRSFNGPGTRPGSYHVNVTHVVAIGADVDWRFDELPAITQTLVLNNRWDLVYQAENILHGDDRPSAPGHLEKMFWGDRQGAGHDEHNYIKWIRDATDHDDLADWLATTDGLYATAGTRFSVKVPDPYLPP